MDAAARRLSLGYGVPALRVLQTLVRHVFRALYARSGDRLRAWRHPRPPAARPVEGRRYTPHCWWRRGTVPGVDLRSGSWGQLHRPGSRSSADGVSPRLHRLSMYPSRYTSGLVVSGGALEEPHRRAAGPEAAG